MDVEQMRAFLIKFFFYTLILVLGYCLLKYVVPFFMPFVLAFLLAFLLKTPTNRLARRLRVKRKPVAILVLTLVYILLAAVIGLLGSRIFLAGVDLFRALPPFYNNVIEPAFFRVGEWLGGLFSRLDPQLLTLLERANQSLTDAIDSAVNVISSAALTQLTGLAGQIPAFLVKALLMVIASYFFVADYYKVASFLANLLPPKGKALLFRIKESGVDTLLKFARAYLILLCLTFVELSVGFCLLRIKNAVLIALATSLVDILPVLGTGTILIPWALYQLFFGSWTTGVGLLILYALITVVRQLLEPRVVGHQIGLYPLATLLTMFAGAQIFGFAGMFALPIAVAVFLQMRREERLAAAASAAGPSKGAPGGEGTPEKGP